MHVYVSIQQSCGSNTCLVLVSCGRNFLAASLCADPDRCLQKTYHWSNIWLGGQTGVRVFLRL